MDTKKGGKGAAKGGKGASDEALKEELESIRGAQTKGWILVDFPRNLDQMKLLETCFSGYVAPTDLPKSTLKQKKEVWSKVVTPQSLVDSSVTGEVNALPSGFDGVIILDAPDEECKRRATGRKVDPQTGTVYHMETEAPDDSKILDRLQDYTDEAGKLERQQKISSAFGQSINAIKQWLTRFGLTDDDGTCQVQLDMQIKLEKPAPEKNENGETIEPKDPWKAKDKVLAAVLDKVQKVCDYRQRQFESRRELVREAMQEQERLEEEQRKERELAEKEASVAAASEAKGDGQSSKEAISPPLEEEKETS